MYKYFSKRYIMAKSLGRMAHLRNIRKKRYGTKSAIKKYVEINWLRKAEKILTKRLTKGFKEEEKEAFKLELNMRDSGKYYVISMFGDVDKKTLAFIDKETGEILRPKFHTKPHTVYQPKSTKSNVNDSSGGFRYVKNINFKFLP